MVYLLLDWFKKRKSKALRSLRSPKNAASTNTSPKNENIYQQGSFVKAYEEFQNRRIAEKPAKIDEQPIDLTCVVEVHTTPEPIYATIAPRLPTIINTTFTCNIDINSSEYANDTEVNDFEKLHCLNSIGASYCRASPTETFFKDNSHPFHNNASPQMLSRKMDEMYQRGCAITRHRMPLPRAVQNGSTLDVSGSYKNFDFYDSSMWEWDVSQNARSRRNIYYQPGVGSDKATANAAIKVPVNSFEEHNYFDKLVDDNNYCQISYLNEVARNQEEADSMDFLNARITDLDESVNISSNSNIYSDLLPIAGTNLDIPDERLNSDKCMARVTECQPKEIKRHTNKKFSSTFSRHLIFSCGTYRKTNVTIRKCNTQLPMQERPLAEKAIEMDYAILRSAVKHSNIIKLMAASYNTLLQNHMILVMEPVDCTLYYLIHKDDIKFSVAETVAVVRQIANATQYLHEFGFVHSNISSHCVLMYNQKTDRNLLAKLSSFELTTCIDNDTIRADIDNKYQRVKSADYENCVPSNGDTYLGVESQYLAYNIDFRQKLSIMNYQAPELVATDIKFVFPTTKSDIYGLTLLLWEMLNGTVPYIDYTTNELVNMFRQNGAHLVLNTRNTCMACNDIFEDGLENDQLNRNISMDEFIQRLEVIQTRIDSRSIIEKPLPPIPMTEMEINSLTDHNTTSFNGLKKDNSIYQSALEFEKFLSAGPHIKHTGRTSTLKRRRDRENPNISIVGRKLFEDSEDTKEKSIDGVVPVIVRQFELPAKMAVARKSIKPNEVEEGLLVDINNNESPPTIVYMQAKQFPIKLNTSNSSFKTLLDYSSTSDTACTADSKALIKKDIPEKITIAQKNKMRRTAWLSKHEASFGDDLLSSSSDYKDCCNPDANEINTGTDGGKKLERAISVKCPSIMDRINAWNKFTNVKPWMSDYRALTPFNGDSFQENGN